LIIVRSHLAFLNHVYQFNALQSDAGRTKRFKAEHWPDDPLDGPMVLFDEIIQILALAYLERMTGFLLKCLESSRIGATLIDSDLVWQTLLTNGFLEKAQSGLFVSVGGEQKVDGQAIPIDSTVKIVPLALDFDVRFVHPILQLLPAGRFLLLRKAASSLGVNF
jgi:hypothetical protein